MSKILTIEELKIVGIKFNEARDNLIDAALILQESDNFISTTKDTKEVIGDLSVAIKALDVFNK